MCTTPRRVRAFPSCHHTSRKVKLALAKHVADSEPQLQQMIWQGIGFTDQSHYSTVLRLGLLMLTRCSVESGPPRHAFVQARAEVQGMPVPS